MITTENTNRYYGISEIGVISFQDTAGKGQAEYQNLSYYLEAATKTILKFGGRNRIRMAADDDLVSFVAYTMMRADYLWEPQYNAGRETYRINGARMAIRAYITAKQSKTHNNTQRLKNPEMDVSDSSVDRGKFGSIIGIDWDYLIERAGLEQSQREYFKRSFKNGESIGDIAKDCGVTRQNVSFKLKRAIEHIKETPECLKYLQQFLTR